MARIRTIKPEFWTSEQVMECSPVARLLFIGLWNFCDDGGNHVSSPRTIKANVLPGDDIDSSSVRRLLDELYTNDLIDFYVVENKRYLHVTGWAHQRIDRPTFKHPEYKQGENDERTVGTRRSFDEASPPEGNVREGNVKEIEAAALIPPEEVPEAPLAAALPSVPEKIETQPKPLADPIHARAIELTAMLRKRGASLQASDPRVRRWAEAAVTDAQALQALELAQQRRETAGSTSPINAGYLDTILADLTSTDKPATASNGAAAQAAEDRWWMSNSGIDRKAQELGLFARGNEDYASFKDRIFNEIRNRKGAPA